MQPLFYAALAFAAGIAAVADGPLWLRALGWPAALAAAVGLLALALRERDSRWMPVLALLACCGAGAGRAASVLRHPAPVDALAAPVHALQPGPHDRVWLSGYLRDDPQTVGNELRLDLEAQAVAAADTRAPARAMPGAAGVVWPVSGGVRLYAYRPGRDAALGTLDTDVGVGAPAPTPAPTGAWPGALAGLHAGDAVAMLVHLRPLAPPRDPGVSDALADLERQGIGWSATLDAGAWRRWPAGAGGPRLLVLRARLWSWLSAHVDALAPPRRMPAVNALLRGMLLGDTARLDAATRTAFQVDGVFHLLVVAGLHVGVLAVFFLLLFRSLRLAPWKAELLTLLLLAAYAWIIVARTPTLRALLMLAVYFGARVWYRRPQPLNAVGAAALLLLWRAPGDLFASGWQMSLGAATLLAGVAAPILAASSAPFHHALADVGDAGRDDAFAPRLAQFRLEVRALQERLGWLWRPLARALPPALRAALRLWEVALISAVLQIGFAAFSAAYFHRANPWSVLANLVLVPAASLLIPLAWCAMALAAAAAWLPAPHLAHALAAAVALPVDRLAGATLRAALAMAQWPAAGLRVPSPPQWFLFCFALAVAAWLTLWIVLPPDADSSPTPAAAVPPAGVAGAARLMPWRRPLRWAAPALVLATAVVLALAPFPPRLPPGLSATILDIGEGDAIFVSFPDGRTLLVDAGPRSAHWDSGEQVVAPFLWSLGLHRIDAVLLTHGHNDHLGGMPAIIRDFHPREAWVTWTLPTEPAVTAFLRQAVAAGVAIRRCRAGQIFMAGAVRIEVFLPPPDYRAGEIASNDDSMTVRLSYGAESMLLTGDTEAGGERWMLAHGYPLASQLLKVGHHGSRTSSTPGFVSAVAPQVAVISDGVGNVYGFPAPDVVRRLEAAGVRVFRTDRDGAIQCRLAPRTLAVYLFPPPPFAAAGTPP